MLTLQEKFVTDSNGRRIAVLLDIEAYYQLLNELKLAGLLRASKSAELSDAERTAIQQQGLEALQMLQRTAVEQGVDQLSADDIEAEIRGARAERRTRA